MPSNPLDLFFLDSKYIFEHLRKQQLLVSNQPAILKDFQTRFPKREYGVSRSRREEHGGGSSSSDGGGNICCSRERNCEEQVKSNMGNR